jgi:serine/threonine protein kinase
VPDATDLRPGDPESIAGYRVLSRLGSGGQGVVFLGSAPSGDLVAIKRLLPRGGPEDTRARAQFVKEVAAARLVAPFCTAQVVDAQVDGDSPYVVSEFIAGPSLQQQIERNGPMQGTALQRMAIGTATALAAIHQAGVVHRDFKPANVMLSSEGPRVIDFGIARDLSTETTVTSRIFGTPAYMSPEQLRADVVGPATDMFAWASVMAYAATGRAPFEAPHIMAVVHRIGAGEPDLSGVPADLVVVLRQCLEKDPARRPTAQQTLALLLGRPSPARDQTDPTIVLAEATGLVRPTDPGRAERPAAEPPLYGQPAESPSSGHPSGSPSYGHPAESPSYGQSPGAPSLGGTRLGQPSFPPGPPAWGSPAPETVASAERGQPAWGTDPGRAQPVWGAAATAVPRPRRRRRRLSLVLAVVAIVLAGTAVRDHLGPFGDAGSQYDLDSDADAQAQAIKEAAESAAAGLDDPVESDDSYDSSDPDDLTDPVEDAGDGVEIPSAFAGTWKGRIVESGTANGYATVRLTLPSGASSGRLKFTELGCSGTVKVTSVLASLLSLEAVMTKDPKGRCSKHSKVWVNVLSSKRLQFSIVDDDKPQRAGTGTLTG